MFKFKCLRFCLRNLFYQFEFIKPYPYDYLTKEHLRFYLPANPVMLDCGAHDGQDSVEMVKAFGGHLHAIEAVPAVYERLIKNTLAFPNISTYNIALGNSNKEISFFVSNGNHGASSSMLAPKDHLTDHPDITFEEKIQATCYTLDNWAGINNVTHIDFMWLDMQGAEKLMLEASEKIIKTVKVIHCEVSLKETYDAVLTYPGFKKFMLSIGFRPEIEVIPPGYDMGDVLFVRYKR